MTAPRVFTCNNCSIEFEAKGSRKRKYCGHKCANEAISRSRIVKRPSQVCKHCKKSFVPKTKDARTFCSQTCARHAQNAKRSALGRVTRVCLECKSEFSSEKNRKKVYCTRTCSNRAIARRLSEASQISVVCACCGDDFNSVPSAKRKYCSIECRNQHIGEGNHLLQKVGICVDCGVETLIARNVSTKRIRCVEHRVTSSKDLLLKCVVCSTSFVLPKGRLKAQKCCSRQCGVKLLSQKMLGTTKQAPCIECGVEVTVAPRYNLTKVKCSEHLAIHRENVRVRRQKKAINQPAVSPYASYTLKHMRFNPGANGWTIHMLHKSSKSTMYMPLAKYVCEARVSRFIREDEKIFFRDSDPSNCSPDNLYLGPKPKFKKKGSWWDRD